MSKLYPVGVQNFEKVILGSYEYVDKTALIYQLFNTGSYYFLSRPRRFGKSLHWRRTGRYIRFCTWI